MRAFHVTIRTPNGTARHVAIGTSASAIYDATAACQSEDDHFGITVIAL